MFCISLCLSANQDDFKDEGKLFGKTLRAKSLDFKDYTYAIDLLSPELRGQIFDGKEAKNQISTQNYSTSPSPIHQLESKLIPRSFTMQISLLQNLRTGFLRKSWTRQITPLRHV